MNDEARFSQVADDRLDDIVAQNAERHTEFMKLYFDNNEFQKAIKKAARKREPRSRPATLVMDPRLRRSGQMHFDGTYSSMTVEVSWYDYEVDRSLPDALAEQARQAVREGRAASVSAYIADAMAQSARTSSISRLVADMRAEDGQPSEEDYAWARRALGVE